MGSLIDRFILSEGWFSQLDYDGVIIYQCEFNKESYQDVLFTQLGVSLNPSLARAVPKRKAEFLAGRYCCKQALSRFNIHNFTVGIGQNRAPQWPVGIKGAISHNTHHAMVALTADASTLGIGIDIETVMSSKTMDNIKEAIIFGDEANHLNVADASPMVALSLIFSFKESFFKAAYPSTGYYFDFDAVTIDTIDYEKCKFSLTVVQDLNPQIRPGMVFEGDFAFVDEQVISMIVV